MAIQKISNREEVNHSAIVPLRIVTKLESSNNLFVSFRNIFEKAIIQLITTTFYSLGNYYLYGKYIIHKIRRKKG